MAHALGYLKRALELLAQRAAQTPVALRVCAGVIAGWLLSAPIASAQPPEQSVRFTVFSMRPITGLAFVPRAGAPKQKIVFYPMARSPRYEFRGVMPVRFVDENTNAVVAEATIPAGMREVFLLFTPTVAPQPGGLRYQISVLDDSVARHGSSGLVIVNLSGLELSGSVGADPVTLKAGLNPTLPLGRTTKLVLRTTSKNRSYQSYSETIELGRNQRALLLLFPAFYQGSLEVQSRLLIDDAVPAGAAR